MSDGEQFMTHIKKLTTEVLELTKLTKVLAVFTKRGSDEVKAFVKVITDNASSSSASNQASSGKTATIDPTSSASKLSSEVRLRSSEESKPLGSTKSTVEARTNPASKPMLKATE